MNLYEVIRWGNDADDPFTGGPNGPDTGFLVRAGSVEQAAALADEALRRARPTRVGAWAGAVHLLGQEHSTDGVAPLKFAPSRYAPVARFWTRPEMLPVAEAVGTASAAGSAAG